MRRAALFSAAAAAAAVLLGLSGWGCWVLADAQARHDRACAVVTTSYTYDQQGRVTQSVARTAC